MKLAYRATLALLTFALPITGGAQPAADRLKTLFEQQWENTLREGPVFATTLGDTRYNDRLSDEGLAAEARRLDSARVFLARLRAIPRDFRSPAPIRSTGTSWSEACATRSSPRSSSIFSFRSRIAKVSTRASRR